jgi:hypothetical protein
MLEGVSARRCRPSRRRLPRRAGAVSESPYATRGTTRLDADGPSLFFIGLARGPATRRPATRTALRFVAERYNTHRASSAAGAWGWVVLPPRAEGRTGPKIEDAALRGRGLYELLQRRRLPEKAKKKKPATLVPFQADRANKIADLTQKARPRPPPRPGDHPARRGSTPPGDGGYDVCANGILPNVPPGKLHNHSPQFSHPSQRSRSTSPLNAAPPTRWHRFLDAVFNGDAETIRALTQMFRPTSWPAAPHCRRCSCEIGMPPVPAKVHHRSNS